MLIASKRKLKQLSYDPCILIGNHNIKQVTNKKVLGITLDDELRRHKHNDLQCKKLSKSIVLLRRAKRFVNQNVLINMYNSLVLPHFTYCSNVWNDGSRTHIDKLLKMQKRAARIITESTYEVRSKDIFNILQWEPIETTLKKREMIMTFKALQGQLRECMTNIFKICLNGMYPLRSNNCKLYLEKRKTDFLKKSFSYRGDASWNNLPNDVTNNYKELSIINFKTLINNYFTNLERNSV